MRRGEGEKDGIPTIKSRSVHEEILSPFWRNIRILCLIFRVNHLIVRHDYEGGRNGHVSSA